MAELVDLWRADGDAERMYQLYLVRLQANGLHDRVVATCRQIRRYAARGPGVEAAWFTFFFERDSLVALQNYKGAWRQLQLRDAIAYGARVPIGQRRWAAKDAHELMYTYAPLLYFLHRDALGCKLMERALGFCLCARKAQSYDLLFHVYNGEGEPDVLARVTLTHFYHRLGRDLKEWKHWPTFVEGLAPKLFRITKVNRRLLLEDSTRLREFFTGLMQVRSKRVTSGVTRGQADLLQSSTNVKKWQERTREQLRAFAEDPARQRMKESMLQLFPDLRELAR